MGSVACYASGEMAEFSAEDSTSFFPLRDHDLLVRLNVHAENLRDDVSTMKTEVVKHVSDINQKYEQLRKELDDKADASVVESLKQFRWMILGAILVLNGLSGLAMFVWAQGHK